MRRTRIGVELCCELSRNIRGRWKVRRRRGSGRPRNRGQGRSSSGRRDGRGGRAGSPRARGRVRKLHVENGG